MMAAPYQPAARARRTAWAPAKVSRVLGNPARLGQQFGLGDMAKGVLALGISGATAYVGLHTGLNQKGLLGVLGWVVGSAGALNAVFMLAGIATVAAGGNGAAPAPAESEVI
jgi:hypothetical protein